MGQRADEVSRPAGSGRPEDARTDAYVVRPGEAHVVTAQGAHTVHPVGAQLRTEPTAETESTQRDDERPEEIRAEMEQTRAEISETIDAIQERLSPQDLKEQARDVA